MPSLESSPEPRKSARPSAEELAKWNAVLGKEGMPEELSADPASKGEERTPAYKSAIHELQLYYLTTNRDDWGAHREKLQGVVADMRSGGATGEEIAEMSEDFMREVEDLTTRISRQAVETAQELVRNPNLQTRPEMMERRITAGLRQSFPQIDRDILATAAAEAVKAVS